MKIKKIQLTKNQIKISAIVVVVIIACLGLRSLCSDKFAIIDLQKVIRNSPELIQLKIDNDKKVTELSKWLDTAKAEISSEKKQAKKEELTREYQEIARKRTAEIKSAYSEQSSKISEEINEIIKKVAHKKGCSQVLVKGAVVIGGIDITEDAIELIRKKEK